MCHKSKYSTILEVFKALSRRFLSADILSEEKEVDDVNHKGIGKSKSERELTRIPNAIA